MFGEAWIHAPSKVQLLTYSRFLPILTLSEHTAI